MLTAVALKLCGLTEPVTSLWLWFFASAPTGDAAFASREALLWHLGAAIQDCVSPASLIEYLSPSSH